MRIGVDIDGVVADSYPAWLQELNLHYGKNISVLHDYEMHLVFDVPWDDMNDFFVQNKEKLLSMPEPIKGAKEAIKTLLDAGHEIIYITARVPEEKEVTLRWLQTHGIPHEHVLFTGFQSKVDLIKTWDIKVFIEDYMVNAKLIAAEGIPVCLLNSSYNQGDTPQGVTRVENWMEILELIKNKND